MHYSVMKEEIINNLNLKEDSIIVDATLGYGGHSSSILKRIKKGFLFAFDQDREAILYSESRLKKIGDNFTIIKANFVNMEEKLKNLGVFQVDGIIFDLGVSSPQLDEEKRGFSFHKDAVLDMRMDQDSDLDAYKVVNTYSEEELTRIFLEYGEDKYSKSIARNIVRERDKKPIRTTLELAEIIKNSVPEKARRKKHPARQIFQAIRIEVNHELEVIVPALESAVSLVKVGGRIEVITFHSLEDKIVKNYFRKLTEVDEKVKGLPYVSPSYLPNFKLVNRKVILPSDDEIQQNNRSRSAKLRIMERIK